MRSSVAVCVPLSDLCPPDDDTGRRGRRRLLSDLDLIALGGDDDDDDDDEEEAEYEPVDDDARTEEGGSSTEGEKSESDEESTASTQKHIDAGGQVRSSTSTPGSSLLPHFASDWRSSLFPACLMDREVGFRDSRRRHLPVPHFLLPRKREPVSHVRAKVFCGTYDSEGSVFLSAAQDCQVRLFDTRSGAFHLIRSVFAQDVGWAVLDTAISPSGRQFAYSSWSPAVRLCNLHTDSPVQHELLSLDSGNRNIGLFSVRFSPNGTEVISGASDYCLYVYDLDSRRQVLKVKAQEGDVNAVAYADASCNLLLSGGDDGLVKVWDRRQLVERRPKAVGVFAGHFDGITFIDAHGDGRHLLSNSKDQTIKVWDVRRFSSRAGVSEARAVSMKGFWDYRWQPVPRRVAASRDRMPGDTSVVTLRGHTVRQTLIRARFSPAHSTGQRFVYSGCASGSVFIFDLLTGNVVSQLRAHTQTCRDVSWHPFFPQLVSSSVSAPSCLTLIELTCSLVCV